MHETADTIARNRLRGDEQLLWSGQPDRARIFNEVDLQLIPNSVLSLACESPGQKTGFWRG